MYYLEGLSKFRVNICSVAYDALAGMSVSLALWIGAFRWVVVRLLRLCVVRCTREQLDVIFYLVCRCLSVLHVRVLTGQTVVEAIRP
jgi:hypothetical protein